LNRHNDPDTFVVQLGDLPDGFTDQVVAELQHFAVPLVLNDHFLGSGVLAQVDNVSGILTAEHVVRNPVIPFDNSSESRQALVTSVSDRANAVCIEMRYLDWWTTLRQSDEWEPDLAFIRLPDPSGFTGELRACCPAVSLERRSGGSF
jgi:hypothetical protein